jgi:hypothetical protein
MDELDQQNLKLIDNRDFFAMRFTDERRYNVPA